MGRKKKYTTEEEKIIARREQQMQYYFKNIEIKKKINLENYYKRKDKLK